MDKGDDPLSVICISLTVSIFPPIAHPLEGIDVNRATGQRLTNLDIFDYLALKIVFTIINHMIRRCTQRKKQTLFTKYQIF